jgi:hypothetical protein
MHSSWLVHMQMSGDAMMKCVSIKERGFRGDAAEQNAALPHGRIIPDLERDHLDHGLRMDLKRTGSRCAACTQHVAHCFLQTHMELSEMTLGSAADCKR